MSDMLDTILKAVKPETPPAEVPPVQTDEQKSKSSMAYSGEFEKAYGKKA